MAPDATVLVAPRRQKRFSYRSYDGDGVLSVDVLTLPTRRRRSASNSGSSWLVWRSSCAALSSPLSARGVARWCSFDLT
eukprot:4487079-Prymnesium_polylepis.1